MTTAAGLSTVQGEVALQILSDALREDGSGSTSAFVKAEGRLVDVIREEKVGFSLYSFA